MIWDVTTGKAIRTISSHRGRFRGIAFDPEGKTIAGLGSDTVKIWDATTGEEISAIEGDFFNNNDLVFSPDGTKIVTSCRAYSRNRGTDSKVWDINTGKEIKLFKGPTGPIVSVAFSPDGRRIVSGTMDNKIKVWDLETHEGVRNMLALATTREISNSTNDALLTCNENVLLKGVFNKVFSLAFSQDGTRIVVSGTAGRREKNSIKIIDATTGKEIKAFKGHEDDVAVIVFSRDGTKIAFASHDNSIKIIDALTGLEIKSLVGHTKRVTDIAFTPEDTRVVSASVDGTLKFWDAKTGKEIKNLESRAFEVAFSFDGSRFVSMRSKITVWDATTGNEIKTLNAYGGRLPSPGTGRSLLAYNPVSSRIAIWNYFIPEIQVFDATSGKKTTSILGNSEDFIQRIAFSPDGSRIVSESLRRNNYACKIKLWDALTGAEIKSLNGYTFDSDCLAFSPDGTRIAAVCGGIIEIWNAPKSAEEKILVGHKAMVRSVAFSPDGTRIATGSEDLSIKIWDTATGHEIKTLTGHSQTVNYLCFNPDGTRIYSIGKSAKSKQESSKQVETVPSEELVWDLDSGTILTDETWFNFGSNDSTSISKHKTSPDRRWFASVNGRYVDLIDQEFKNTPREKAYREIKARLDPFWHNEQAKKAQSIDNSFAATFHYAWVMKAQPGLAENYDNLHNAYNKLAEQYKTQNKPLDPYLAPIVKQMLKLPRGGVEQN